jgi:DNA-directed RNA polymerase specialized sigma24 family protein
VSPLSLRRYRAERLLREEFDQLKGRVMAVVRGRLRARGVHLDGSDLEACYAQAWHGLYAAMLDGQDIANPTGWLTLVTFRRAIEEHRARGLSDCNGSERVAEERDLAATLDDRVRLRQLFEALRGRLSERELQAAALCYLQGLSRSEAAARLGVSEARMRKLMEGCGPGRPGVAGKVGALVETIRGGGWCEEQGSLMRGLAYGILDPEGERYRLAMIHRSECPACRAYVLSLRGLAALLPPVPALMHWAMHAGAAAGTGAAAAAGTGAGAGVGSSASAHGGVGLGTSAGTGGQAATGALAPAGSSVAGAVSASAGAGAGAAGGSWLLAGGPVGAKLAVGCLLALGIGAGCAALTDRSEHARAPVHRRESAGASQRLSARGGSAATAGSAGSGLGGGDYAAQRVDDSARATTSAALTPAEMASREFGPEQVRSGEQRSASPEQHAPTATSASAGATPSTAHEPSPPPASAAGSSTPAEQSAGALAAEREFSPG